MINNNIKMNRSSNCKDYSENSDESEKGDYVSSSDFAFHCIAPGAAPVSSRSGPVGYTGGDENEDKSVLQCDNCRATFKTKTQYEKHTLFCATLAGMRNTSSGSSSSTLHNQNTRVRSSDSGRNNKKYTIMSVEDDALLPTPKEMFMLIQELTLKYNKVKEELDIMKTWAKMVGRRIGGNNGGDLGGSGSGVSCPLSDYLIPFTSLSRQKKQNMEMILNDYDAEMSAAALSTGQPCPLQQRPSFTKWYTSFTINQEHLDIVFNSDLVSGIVSILLKMVSAYTNETGNSHLIPFKFTDVKQGSFYIYDAPFSLDAPVLPNPQQPEERKWRFIEPCEFQLMVNTVNKLLLKEFKKWQDHNWGLQNQLTKQKKKATLSYEHMMSSFQCSPAMASCDGMYSSQITTNALPKMNSYGGGGGCVENEDLIENDHDDEPNTPPIHLKDAVLTEDFASLYNKYADKVMGGTLTPETIITRVRAKLWKDMKAWML
jgi:hypothetical protein